MAHEPDVGNGERGPARDLLASRRAAHMGIPLLRRRVLACLVVGILAAASALVWRVYVQGDQGRSAPKLDMRYDAAAAKLALPQRVSPSEEYLGPSGEVVFVTEDELRAVSQAAELSATTARKLAAALAEREPTRRVEQLFGVIDDVPATPAGDKQAMMLYRFVSSALSASDAPTRGDTKAKLDRMIGCRFVGPRLPPCLDRPSDAPLWAFVALAIAALAAGTYGLVGALMARQKARRGAQTDDAIGDEAEESA
jgi:hypothetical protein